MKQTSIKRRFCSSLLKCFGWKSIGAPIPTPKCIILGAPHTSIWDFVISLLFYTAVGGKASVLVKKEFFVWPVKGLMRRLGAIPVDRSKGASFVKQIVETFNSHETLHVAIAPEGTRNPTSNWKGGFYTISKAANVPVYFGFFDWGRKEVGVAEELLLSNDQQADIKRVRQWYNERGVKGKHPKKFITGFE